MFRSARAEIRRGSWGGFPKQVCVNARGDKAMMSTVFKRDDKAMMSTVFKRDDIIKTSLEKEVCSLALSTRGSSLQKTYLLVEPTLLRKLVALVSLQPAHVFTPFR